MNEFKNDNEGTNKMKKSKNYSEMKYSSKTHLSYALGGFLVNFITSAFIVRTILNYYIHIELNLEKP